MSWFGRLEGSSVMVWEMFSVSGLYSLVQFHFEVMTAVYKNLPQEHMILVFYNKWPCKRTFFRIVALANTTKSVIHFLEDGSVEVTSCHEQSPLLNPTETPRKIIGENVMARKPTNIVDFIVSLKKE